MLHGKIAETEIMQQQIQSEAAAIDGLRMAVNRRERTWNKRKRRFYESSLSKPQVTSKSSVTRSGAPRATLFDRQSSSSGHQKTVQPHEYVVRSASQGPLRASFTPPRSSSMGFIETHFRLSFSRRHSWSSIYLVWCRTSTSQEQAQAQAQAQARAQQ